MASYSNGCEGDFREVYDSLPTHLLQKGRIWTMKPLRHKGMYICQSQFGHIIYLDSDLTHAHIKLTAMNRACR